MTFAEVMDELGVAYKEAGQHHHVSEGWVGVDCVFCSPESGSFRLGYNVRFGSMSCWSCGRVNLYDFLREVDPARAGAIAKALRKDAGRDFGERIPRKQLPKVVIPKCVGVLTPAHKQYLRRRGLDPSEVQRVWKIEGIGHDGGNLKWRLWIPVILNGETVSWTTRAIGDAPGQLRYLSCPSEHEKVPHKHLLLGEDLIPGRSVIIHEGPVDAFATGPGAVCTFGVNYTPHQVARIARYRRRTICFDATPEGQAAARKLAAELGVFEGETYNVRLTGLGKDAADLDEGTRAELRRRFLH